MSLCGARRACLCLALLPALARAEVQEGGLVRIPIPGGALESLHVQHPLGALLMRGWDRPEIHISFHKRAPGARMLERLRVQVDIKDSRVQIRSGVEIKGQLRALPQADAGIDLTIDAPQRAQLYASTFSGDLRISGFRSLVDLGTARGAIRVSDVSGLLRTHTGNGDQWLQAIQGEVSASGVEGDLELRAVEGDRLSAQVVRGHITARDIRTRSASLHATLGTLLLFGALLEDGSYQLHVDEGDVRVALDPAARFAVTASGPIIHNTLRLDPGPRNVQRPGFLRGERLGGGPRLSLTSVHGQVHLLSEGDLPVPPRWAQPIEPPPSAP